MSRLPKSPRSSQSSSSTRSRAVRPALTDAHRSSPVAHGPHVSPPAVLSDGEVMDLATTFRVLADPTRVRLIAALLGGEQPVGELATLVSMSESAVSHQLRVLRAARIVRGRPEGRQVFYTLDDAHVVTLFKQALSHVAEDACGEDVS